MEITHLGQPTHENGIHVADTPKQETIPWRFIESDQKGVVWVKQGDQHLFHCHADEADVIARAVARRSVFDAMLEALEELLRQITIGTFFDEHGHNAHNLKALHDARNALKLAKGEA